jgi:GT2 family glycosyltransferase
LCRNTGNGRNNHDIFTRAAGYPMIPLISVIVVNYNGLRFLRPCLSSLVCQSFKESEIILVDNGSSDGSPDYVRQHFPSVILVETGKNRGFGGGVNAGIAIARGEFILTLNNDIIADIHLLEEIHKPMLCDPDIGMCAAKMLLPDGRIYSAGICIFRSGAAMDRGIYEPDNGKYDREEDVFGSCAGTTLYRRSMLDTIGLFDEDFFLYMEDVDLAFRGQLSGWRCRYVPAARVIHEYGGTAGINSDISVYYGNRNLLWYVVKDFPARLFLSWFPWIIGRACADIPYYFVKGKGKAILKAKIDGIKGLPAMIKKRRTIKKEISDTGISKWIRN